MQATDAISAYWATTAIRIVSRAIVTNADRCTVSVRAKMANVLVSFFVFNFQRSSKSALVKY